jgi:hypothetical protein
MARKALLCGINAYAEAPLRGCLNDVRNLRDLLISTYDFSPGDVRVLEDEAAVKSRLLQEWQWLVGDAAEGDTLVFHFSGHGSYVPDRNGDEEDLRDEITCLYGMDFDDPGTFLSDDEWYELARAVSPAVHLLLIKDTCHSGGSSRFLRVRTDEGAERTILAPERPTPARGEGPVPERTVTNARFLKPPQASENAWRGRVGAVRTTRLAQVPQTSLMACMETQTAADAAIAGDFHGAFTYHLCEQLRQACDLSSTRLIEAVAKRLQGGYEQIPQHEGRDLPAPILGFPPGVTLLAEPEPAEAPETPLPLPESAPAVAAPTEPWPGDAFSVEAGVGRSGLSSAEMVYRAHLRFLDTMAALAGVPLPPLPEPGSRALSRVLVSVHGIGTHPRGYSDRWWAALSPHVGAVYDPSALGLGRQEVLWSDLVNRGREMARGRDPAVANELRADILAVIEDRRDQAVARSGRFQPAPVPRGGALAFDDFLVYMLDDGMRRRILQRFTDVVGPLLAAGRRIDVISHSWGTVVAYEGLRELGRRGAPGGRVANWFTLGSALSIGPVQARLRPENRPPAGGRAPCPALVDAWINLDAQGDLVGGPLGSRFAVTAESLELRPVTCPRQWWGGYELTCAHGSYFEKANLAVNRDILARHILS